MAPMPRYSRSVLNRRFGHVGLKNRDGGKAGTGERGEIGYPIREDSPANPPYRFTDGHIRLAEAMTR